MRTRLLAAVAAISVLAAASWLLGRHGWGARAAERARPESAAKEAGLNYEESNGKKLFEHYCAVCHGATGEGDGFNAYNLNPKPRNLADRNAMAAFSDQQLFDAISRGAFERGKSNLMPPWGHTLNERQIRYLVACLRTLRESK
ncbi:MAG: c-type cytochrome [Acidobacteria bacterium]|nr:c-type cytochrome [Acidobacteriota bacterium]